MTEPYYMSLKEIGDMSIPQAVFYIQLHNKHRLEYKKQKKRALESVLRSNKKGLQKVINIADLIQD